jgi:hypothetical protein
MEEKKLTDEVENVVKVLSDFHKRVLNTKLAESIFESEILAIIYAKELIHRLQDENKALLKENEALSISFYGVQNQARERCNELQKQVDELKEERYYTEQDTAKEILGLILAKEFEKGDYLTDDELKKLFEEKYGVEVE